MKNILKGIFAVASMALIGCSQDEQLVVMNDTSETFTGVMEVSESRTGLGENGDVVWSDEDAISIFKMSGYHQKYQVEKGGNTTATFKYANESKEHNANLTMNYAVYPYDPNHSIADNGKITLDLSSLAKQEYTEGSFENGQSAMVAKSSSQDLPFFNTLAMLRVKLCSEVPGDYSIKSITLTSNSKTLSGTATVDMSQDKQPAVFDANGNKTITLTCTQPVQLKENCDGTTGGHDFYILVPVGTYPANDLTIRIEGENSKILYEAPYTKELNLERSGITTIHHKFGEEDWSGYIEPSVVITTADDLFAFAKNVNENKETYAGQTVILAADIDLDNAAWTPIGALDASDSATDPSFNGTFDGNGHTIKNLKIDEEYADKNGVGLFASNAVYDDIVIKDLTVEGATVYGNKWVGVIQGYTNGTITNCTVKNATVYAENGYRAGAVVGYVAGTATNNKAENCTIYVSKTVDEANNAVVGTDNSEDAATNIGTNTATNCNVVAGKLIKTADELVALGGTNINGTYVLMADLDMTGKNMESMVVPGGASVNFIGNGHTISNLVLGAAGNYGMTGDYEVAGMFDLSAPSSSAVSLTVSDLTIKDVEVNCTGYAAAIVGYTSNGKSEITLNNVDVDDANVTAATVAALVGYTIGKVNLNGCDVSNLNLTGEKAEKTGAYVGTANGANCVVTITNCTNGTTYNNFGRVINDATAN